MLTYIQTCILTIHDVYLLIHTIHDIILTNINSLELYMQRRTHTYTLIQMHSKHNYYELGLPYFGTGDVDAYDDGAPSVGAHDVGACDASAPNAGALSVGSPGVGAIDAGAHIIDAHNFGAHSKTPVQNSVLLMFFFYSIQALSL